MIVVKLATAEASRSSARRSCTTRSTKARCPALSPSRTKLGTAAVRAAFSRQLAAQFATRSASEPSAPQAGAEMLAQGLRRSRRPVAAIRACGPLSEPSDRSARAAENITALGEMTRGIAHDFRNVLCMLTSGLNIAEASIDEPEKLGLALAAMHEGIARGLRVTNRLLDFSRQQELGPGTEDINSLLAAMKAFLGYGAGPGIGDPRAGARPSAMPGRSAPAQRRDPQPRGQRARRDARWRVIRISTAWYAHGGEAGITSASGSATMVSACPGRPGENLRSVLHHQGRQRNRPWRSAGPGLMTRSTAMSR